VAEDPSANRSFEYDATVHRGATPSRGHFDREPHVLQTHQQRRVVEIGRSSVFMSGRRSLEDPPIPPDGPAAGAEGQPIERDAAWAQGRWFGSGFRSWVHLSSYPLAGLCFPLIVAADDDREYGRSP
jgi:hypothetical protein